MARRKGFQYHALLRVRERQEELKALALAAVRRTIEARERERAAIIDEQRRTLVRAGDSAHEGFDAANLLRYYAYERHLAHLAQEKDVDLVNLRAQHEKRRLELDEAMKRRRIIERLKDRQNRAFAKDMRKLEQQHADEIATSRAAVREGDEKR